MKHLRPFFAATLALGLASILSAADAPKPPPAPPTVAATDPAAYPLANCVVSGEPLDAGHAGGPFDYIHKAPGQPDRLVRFCCKACLKDFKKDPGPYLAKIDAATSAKAK